jgi:hypothetical protein
MNSFFFSLIVISSLLNFQFNSNFRCLREYVFKSMRVRQLIFVICCAINR